jgi:hypothetical protein
LLSPFFFLLIAVRLALRRRAVRLELSRSQPLRRQLRKSAPILAAGDVVAGPDATVVRPSKLRLRLALDVFDTLTDRNYCDFVR